MKIKIISVHSQDNPFLVIEKPAFLPSAPLIEGEDSAITQAASLFPELKNVIGKKKIEYGLMHRLDTETSGLLLIASTQFSYDNLMEQQKSGNFEKTYEAICSFNKNEHEVLKAFPPLPKECQILKDGKTYKLESRFRFFGEKNREVRPVTGESGMAALKKCSEKTYETEIKIEKIENDRIKAICRIKEGFRHQVRCHLAWLNIPVVQDRLYNPDFDENATENLMFRATAIKFLHPLTGKLCTFKI